MSTHVTDDSVLLGTVILMFWRATFTSSCESSSPEISSNLICSVLAQYIQENFIFQVMNEKLLYFQTCLWLCTVKSVPERQACWMHMEYCSQPKFIIIATCFSSTNCHQALLYKNVRKYKCSCRMHWWLVRSHKLTFIY